MGGSNTSHPHRGDQLSFTCRLSTRKVVKFGEMLATMSTLTGTRPCPGASRTCTSLPPLHLIYSGETEAESHSIPPHPSIHSQTMTARVWGAPSRRALLATVDENKSSQTQSVVPVGKGVAIPSSGECPEPFSKTAFIGIVVCRDIRHTCIAHQSLSKGYSYKNILFTDDN